MATFLVYGLRSAPATGTAASSARVKAPDILIGPSLRTSVPRAGDAVSEKAGSGTAGAVKRSGGGLNGRREEPLELGPAGAAEAHAGAAGQQESGVPAEQGLDLAHTLQVHDRGTVHPEKPRGVEDPLQL